VILDLVSEITAKGVSLAAAAEVIGLSARCIERWRRQGGGEDQRRGPKSAPANKLSAEEREHVLKVANSVEYRDLPPKQISPPHSFAGPVPSSDSIPTGSCSTRTMEVR
jgi:hypothetical protein